MLDLFRRLIYTVIGESDVFLRNIDIDLNDFMRFLLVSVSLVLVTRRVSEGQRFTGKSLANAF